MTNELLGTKRLEIFIASGALVVTMLTSVIGIWVHFDNRLDELEIKSSLLLDADGEAKPSAKAIKAIYMLEAIYERMRRLEALHEPGHPHMQ